MNNEISPSKKARIYGWILSSLAITFLLLDSLGKFAKPEEVVKATLDLGYPENAITTLGIILFVSTIIYAIPRVSVFGAILLTGYLGGAVASNFRVGSPLFSHILFPVYIALLVWIGLYLRNMRLRELLFGK